MTSRLIYRERENTHYIVREFNDSTTPCELVFESRNVHDVEMLLPQLQNAEGDGQPPQAEIRRNMDSAPKVTEREAIEAVRKGYVRRP